MERLVIVLLLKFRLIIIIICLNFLSTLTDFSSEFLIEKKVKSCYLILFFDLGYHVQNKWNISCFRVGYTQNKPKFFAKSSNVKEPPL